MRRVIGMDIHRTFAEVVFWEDGKLRPAGRISMTRAGPPLTEADCASSSVGRGSQPLRVAADRFQI